MPDETKSDRKNAFPHSVASDRPAIRVIPGAKVAINRNVLLALGTPKHIQFWWSFSERLLLIGNAPSQSPYSIEISDHCYRLHGNTNFRNSKLMNAIMGVTQWSSNITYAILGKYDPVLNMVVFPICDAVESEAV